MFFLSLFILLRESLIFSLIITSIIGIAKEIYDKYTPGRECDIKDVIADALGIIAGIIIVTLGNLNF